MLTRARRGFTLLELIVVIAVLAIIALIAVPRFSDIINNASQSTATRTAENIYRSVGYRAQQAIRGARNIDLCEAARDAKFNPAKIDVWFVDETGTAFDASSIVDTGETGTECSETGTGTDNAHVDAWVYINASAGESDAGTREQDDTDKVACIKLFTNGDGVTAPDTDGKSEPVVFEGTTNCPRPTNPA